MSVKAYASNLAQSAKELSIQWQETKAYWTDTKSISFEKNYLDGIPSIMVRTSAVMEEIDDLLRKVHADCE